MGIYGLVGESLDSGRQCAVITRLGEGGVTKEALTEDSAGWSALEPVLPRTGYHESDPALVVLEGGNAIAEFYTPRPRALIFGAGHISSPVSRMAAMTGFEVHVHDDRPSYADPRRFPEASGVVCDSFPGIMKGLVSRPHDYCVIVTRGHQHDGECLRSLLSRPECAYIGMIGSRRKVALIRERLIAEGYERGRVDRLHSPIGLDIGAVTPEEIAVAIVAQMISVRRAGTPRGYESCSSEFAAWIDSKEGEPMALITVLSASGSSPRKAGAKMALMPDTSQAGSIGGGCAEADALTAARRVLRNGGHEVITLDLSEDLDDEGMACGGTMQVLIERFGRENPQ